MGKSRFVLLSSLHCILYLFTISSANPLETTPFSEIQIKDQSHFAIEFDAKMVMSTFPAHLDSVFLYCGGDTRPPIDSMKKCEKPVDIDSNGIALITEKNFPNFLIKPGKLYLGYKKMICNPQLLVTSSIYSKIFISGYTDPVCCGDYLNGQCMMYCRSLKYTETQCTSFGIRNNLAEVKITGQIRNYNNSIPDSIQVLCTSKNYNQSYSSTDGTFKFSLTDCANRINLKFNDKNGNQVKDTIIGPFSLGTNVPISVKVSATSSKIPNKFAEKSSNARILTASVTKGIVFTLSGASISQGAVQIYSNDGRLIKKLLFNSHGAGTYTVNWNGKNEHNQKVPSGIYTVRILSGRESLCTGIVNL